MSEGINLNLSQGENLQAASQENLKNESKCLLILNLQRPFVNSALEALLSKYGKVERFWIDFIKTHCYVEYSNIDQAREAKNNLNGLKWPVDGKLMAVDFVSESELNLIFEKNQSPYEKEKIISHNMGNTTAGSSEFVLNVNTLQNLQEGILVNNTNTNAAVKENFCKKSNTNDEPVKTLDSLFRKTETKPHLYFLPLSEEEVEEKRNRLKRREREIRDYN